MIKKRPHWLLMTLVLCGLFFVPAAARAGLLPAGVDSFETLGAEFTLPNNVPAGFFGLKNGVPSDPIPAGTTIDLVGDPQNKLVWFQGFKLEPVGHDGGNGSLHQTGVTLMPVTIHGFLPNVDTVVERPVTVKVPKEVDAMVTVPIKMEQLDLKSMAAIEVTYGAEPSSFFDVFVNLHPDQNMFPQIAGRMKLTVSEIDRSESGFTNLTGIADFGTVIDWGTFFLDHMNENALALHGNVAAELAANPDLLGLPVTSRIQFFEAGADPNAAAPFREFTHVDVLHGEPEPTVFTFKNPIPEPVNFTLAGMSFLALVRYGWRRGARELGA